MALCLCVSSRPRLPFLRLCPWACIPHSLREASPQGNALITPEKLRCGQGWMEGSWR